MSDISVSQRGSFDKTEQYLRRLEPLNIAAVLEKHGAEGVRALSEATPRDSGLAANSWYYTVVERPGYASLRFHNNDIENGFPVAVMIQYGHGTGTGGYIEGKDYIMPAILPVFTKILDDVVKEVTK